MISLEASRALMGDSLGFHIIFAMFGVGLPVAVGWVECWAIRRKDAALLHIAEVLTRIMVLLVVVGVASGTLIAIQMYTFWPGLMEFGRPILKWPFQLEGIAFMLEAVFLVAYWFTWKRFKNQPTGYWHVWLLVPVMLGAVLSAVSITLANAWMNDPQGFTLVDGVMTNVNVIQGLFTETALYVVTHSVTSYYLTTFLTIAGVCAWYLWRKPLTDKQQATAKLLLRRFLYLALICEVIMAATGDMSARHLADSQPAKFAAMQYVTQTGDQIPYIIGGSISEDGTEVEGGIRIPNGLSYMVGQSADTVIIGLNEFPREDWPMLIIHTLFEFKALFIGFLFFVPIAVLALDRYWKKLRTSNVRKYWWVWLPVALTGPVSILTVELGWMVTELGRQPFVVAGYVRTADAFAANGALPAWGYAFPIIFIGLFIITGFALKRIAWKH